MPDSASVALSFGAATFRPLFLFLHKRRTSAKCGGQTSYESVAVGPRARLRRMPDLGLPLTLCVLRGVAGMFPRPGAWAVAGRGN